MQISTPGTCHKEKNDWCDCYGWSCFTNKRVSLQNKPGFGLVFYKQNMTKSGEYLFAVKKSGHSAKGWAVKDF